MLHGYVGVLLEYVKDFVLSSVLNVFPTGELLLQGHDLQVAPEKLHGIAFEMKETNPLLQQNRVKTKGESAVL